MMLKKCYLLQWTVDYGTVKKPEVRTFSARFPYTDHDESMMAAKKDMIARVAITRIISPEAVFKCYAMTSEQLDWVV
jgi:hypothetical protein